METVYYHKSRIELQPWKDWSEVRAPVWWTMYNKVKHHRMEKDTETKKQYYIYSYDFTGEFEITKTMELNPYMIEEEVSKKKEIALLFNKSYKCCMKRWYDTGCYSAFMGQEFFDVSRLKKIMDDEML